MSDIKQAELFLSRVEKYLPIKSNVELMKRILTELHLDKLATDNKEFNDFIKKITTQEIDLSKIIKHVKDHSLNNQPLCSLFAHIEKNNLISDAELAQAKSTMQLQLHLLCVLEAITITIANAKDFGMEVYRHLQNRSGNYFPGNPLAEFFLGVPYDASAFERLKMLSIRPGMLNILFHRQMGEKEETTTDAKTFITNNKLSSWNADIIPAQANEKPLGTVSAMGLNILEASWTDSQGLNKDMGGLKNAEAGLGLINIMEEKQYSSQYKMLPSIFPEGVNGNGASTYELLTDLKVDTTTKKRVMQFNVDSDWRDSYTSWNLLFVIANIDPVFLVLKLLLPTVLSAHPENYKEVRVISLYLLGCLFLNESTRTNPFFANGYHFEQAKIILKAWGDINKNFVSDRLGLVNTDSKKVMESIFYNTFGNYPNANFVWQLYSYMRNPNQHKFTKPSPQFFGSSKTTTSSLKTEVTMEAPGLDV